MVRGVSECRRIDLVNLRISSNLPARRAQMQGHMDVFGARRNTIMFAHAFGPRHGASVEKVSNMLLLLLLLLVLLLVFGGATYAITSNLLLVIVVVVVVLALAGFFGRSRMR